MSQQQIPTSTVVLGPRRRSIGFDTFADLTTAPVVALSPLTFDGDLAPEVVEAVWSRMTSTDDVDQARRTLLHEACEGGATNLLALLCGYVTDRPMPDPIYPE